MSTKENFEIWARSQGLHMTHLQGSNEYESYKTQGAWLAWQAAQPSVPDGWLPTPENINALSEPVRRYICELEANADPAGIVAKNALLRDRERQLERMYKTWATGGRRCNACTLNDFTSCPHNSTPPADGQAQQEDDPWGDEALRQRIEYEAEAQQDADKVGAQRTSTLPETDSEIAARIFHKPDPAMAGDEWITELRVILGLSNIAERNILDVMMHARKRVQPASDDDVIDALQRMLDGKTVSMDVSTGDHDAGNRIYGKVYCVQEDSDDGFTVLAIEDSRNFVQPASGEDARDAARYRAVRTISCAKHDAAYWRLHALTLTFADPASPTPQEFDTMGDFAMQQGD